MTTQVIGHITNYTPAKVDLRAETRAMDWQFMTNLAPEIIGNQCIDFEKQDGITEIEESVQANRVEQRLNDALFQAEERGEVGFRGGRRTELCPKWSSIVLFSAGGR